MNIKIIEKFLTEGDLNELSSLQLKNTNRNSVNVYHNEINPKKMIKNDCIKKKTLERLHESYHPKAIEILQELNPSKVHLYDYSEFHIIETGADFKFPIHDDTPNKLLSGVIYLKPKNNNGTVFYTNKKGDGKKEIEWKINRAVFFSRAERTTWHSYQGDGKSNRIVLVYNLMTKRIKEVFKVENKNFIVGNLRYKLNPYIYRFFKKTI